MVRSSLFVSAIAAACAITFSLPAHAADKSRAGVTRSDASATSEFSSHRRRVVVVRRHYAPRVWVAPRRYAYRPYRVYRPYAPVVIGAPVYYSSPYSGVYGWRGCRWGGCGWGGPGWGGPGWGGPGWGGYGWRGYGWGRPVVSFGVWW